MDKLLTLVDNILRECSDVAVAKQLVYMRSALVILSKRKGGCPKFTTVYRCAFSHLVIEMEKLRDTELEEVCMELDSTYEYEEE